MLVGDIVTANARRTPDGLAFADSSRAVTWGELDVSTNRLARALDELRRVGRYPHVAVVGGNGLDVIATCFGAAKAAIPLVLLKPAFRPSELARLIDHGDVGAVVIEPRYHALVAEALDLLPHGSAPRVIAGVGDGHGADVDLVAEAGRQPAHALPVMAGADRSPFVIAYTSGTTGDPKGAVVTHRNAVAGAFTNAVEARILPHQRVLFWSALFTMGGLGVLLAPTVRGCATWVLDYHAQNDADHGPVALFEAIERHRINFLIGGPIFFFSDERAENYDLSSLETVVNGTASVGRAGRLLSAFERLGPCRVMNLYGMTESSGSAITILQKEELRPAGDDQERARALSVGRAAAGVDLRVVADGRDVDLTDEAIGEVWLRGDAIVQEYWRNPEANAEAFVDGWFRTGDLARRDRDGNLYIVDRCKDVIRSGSANIYSFEVETVLSEHPAVAEVAVVGVPHEFYGETPKAFVRLRPGRLADAEELVDFVRQRLASYKKPSSVEFVDAFPRNSSGKILKRELRAPYWVGVDRTGASTTAST